MDELEQVIGGEQTLGASEGFLRNNLYGANDGGVNLRQISDAYANYISTTGAYYTQTPLNPLNTGLTEDIISSWGSIRSAPSAQKVKADYSAEKVAETWLEELKGYSNSGKQKISRSSKSNSPQVKVKSKISINQAVDAIDELIEKDLCEFIITGSVALYMQGKLSRKEFSDVDLVSFHSFNLDDDMSKVSRPKYETNKELGELSAFVFNGIVFDVFSFSPETKITTTEVTFKGKTYLCQDYREIVKAKLLMTLPKMKDFQEIWDNIIEINFK